ncbi:MAG: C25 family peptidase propeptide domain-containing protein [Bacteroidota bacterium]|nr:C25 family peptidase propeptide domain-containing protein [Bacteroidota bacterium]
MKKYLTILFTLSFFMASAKAQWIGSSGKEGEAVDVKVIQDGINGTVIELQVPGFYLSNLYIQGKTYSVVSLPKVGTFLNKGFPKLPKLNQNIVIPDNAKMSFEIVEAEYETTQVHPLHHRKGDYRLAPILKLFPILLIAFISPIPGGHRV